MCCWALNCCYCELLMPGSQKLQVCVAEMWSWLNLQVQQHLGSEPIVT